MYVLKWGLTMSLSLTELRNNLYKIVDQVIETGIPVEVTRNNHKIKIILSDGPSKLERLSVRQNVFNDDPESIVNCNWISEWSQENRKDE